MPPRTRRGAPRGGATAAVKHDDDEPAPAPAREPDTATAAASSSAAPARASAARSFKLRPKVVRRADDERRALAEQEEKKLLDRAAADDARRKRESRMRGGRGRGRGGRGRGRGDFSGGRDGLVRRTVAPDGPFSQLPGTVGRGRPGLGAGGGFGGGFGGGGGGFGSGRGVGSSGGLMSGGGRVEVDLRLNTDMFNGRLTDFGGGEDVPVQDEFAGETISSTSSGKKAGSQLLPMGIKREEHHDTGIVVAATDEQDATTGGAADAGNGGTGADADADDSSSDLFVDNGDATAAGVPADDNEVWSRAIKRQRSVKIVGVDGREIEITDIDTLAEKREEIAAARQAQAGGESAAEGAAGAATRTRRRRPQKEKDPEEMAVEEGLQAMLHDLALDPPRDPAAVPPTRAGVEGDEPQQQAQEPAEAPPREGRLFLFQFPPVLPKLQPFRPSAGTGAVVKQEPNDHGDIAMLDSLPLATATAAVDLTGVAGEASGAGDAGDKDKTDADADKDGRKPSDIGDGGFLGKLTIRKSGRAEINWGGMTYEMMPGADVQFLTTAVLLEEADAQPLNPAAADAQVQPVSGNAFGMGSVGGKYNLVPVFSDETEWTVSEAELEMYGMDEDEDEDEDEELDGEA